MQVRIKVCSRISRVEVDINYIEVAAWSRSSSSYDLINSANGPGESSQKSNTKRTETVDSLPDHEGISRLACELEVVWWTGLVCSIASIGDNQVGTLEVGATSARRRGVTGNERRS